MKIAICFYGYFGKTNISRIGRSNNLCGYKLENYNEMWSINHFKKNVIQNYDVDIFFHTWETNDKINNGTVSLINNSVLTIEITIIIVIARSVKIRCFVKKK